MSVASSWPQWRVVPSIPWYVYGCITSWMLTPPPPPAMIKDLLFSFTTNVPPPPPAVSQFEFHFSPFWPTSLLMTFGQIKVSNHPCSSSSGFYDTVLTVPPWGSYCFYPVFTIAWHCPQLNTAKQCYLSVVVLIIVMTTNRVWTRWSNLTNTAVNPA